MNPVAGLGGSAGLKGSDGSDVQARAIQLGARPRSVERATEALLRLRASRCTHPFTLITCRGSMGEQSAHGAEMAAVVLEIPRHHATSAADTIQAATRMAELGVDLLLFAGGDGTARAVRQAVGDAVVVLGIPAGVKMQSGVFAVSPVCAGELAKLFYCGNTPGFCDGEVMDLDEAAAREGAISPVLHGYLRVPSEPRLVQSAKVRSAGAANSASGIAWDVTEAMKRDCLYVLGPGTTTRAIALRLGLERMFTPAGKPLTGAKPLASRELSS